MDVIYANKAIVEQKGAVEKDSLHYADVDFIKLQANWKGNIRVEEVRGLDSKSTEYAQVYLHSREEAVTDSNLGQEIHANGFTGQWEGFNIVLGSPKHSFWTLNSHKALWCPTSGLLQSAEQNNFRKSAEGSALQATLSKWGYKSCDVKCTGSELICMLRMNI